MLQHTRARTVVAGPETTVYCVCLLCGLARKPINYLHPEFCAAYNGRGGPKRAAETVRVPGGLLQLL